MRSEGKWPIVPIKDVCVGIYDGPHATPPPSNKGGIFLGISNLSAGHLDLSDIRYISDDDMPKWTKRVTPQAHDIVFSYEATLNLYAIIPEGFYGCLGRRLALMRANPEVIDYRFLYYYMYSKAWRQIITKNIMNGSTVDRIPINRFPMFPIELPELSTQRSIVEILAAIDDKIETNERINDILEQQAKAIYNEIVSLTIERKGLFEFLNIKHGYAFKGKYIASDDNDVVLVTPGNFRIGGGFKEDKCKYFSAEYPEEYVLHANDLIVTMTDLSKEADTLGYGAFVPDNPERVYLHNQRIGLVQMKNLAISKHYVYWYLRSYDYHTRIVGSASGSTVKHTSPGRILEQKIPIPSETDVSKIKIIERIDETIAQNELENRKLSQIRDTLLPRLMSGEIDVSKVAI